MDGLEIMMLLTLATHNLSKKRELEILLSSIAITGQEMILQTLADVGVFEEIPETGMTFAENALLKAKTVFEKTGGFVLSDDSGLVVNALSGAPGVFSARYGTPPYSDEKNRQKLLQSLIQVPMQNRQAYFCCVLCLIGPNKEPQFFEGRCLGFITEEAKGENGFGYDSVFIADPKEWDSLSSDFIQKQELMGKTFAELPLVIKNQLSHRFKAVLKLSHHLFHKSSY